MFEIKDQFLMDGKPVQIISGSIHYFRIVPEYWRDRLEKLRNMGCNTVETYIPWNFHEEEKGVFRWDGMRDVCKFLDIAKDLGLYVIVRPSPYICAEWEFGGLPAWLLNEQGMRLRCNDEKFLAAVRAYYHELLPRLKPYLQTNGGPIIMLQVENEYGSYGDDKDYLRALMDIMREEGMDVPFVTSDGPNAPMLGAGTCEGAFATCNFGSRVKEQFAVMDELLGKAHPKMIMEFWCGWFDAWGGEKHMRSDLEQNKRDLDDLLRLGGHINFYMFNGGTNFGFTNGANYYDHLTPDVTSYDYDGVLTEDGQETEKYRAFREIISRYHEVPNHALTTTIHRKAFGKAKLARRVGLFETLDTLATPVSTVGPKSMEELHQSTGYVLYDMNLGGPETASIRLQGASDRVNAFADGERLFTLYDQETAVEQKLDAPRVIDQLSLLVENMGRVNYGPKLESQKKGITGGAWINGHMHFGYRQHALPLDEKQLARIDFTRGFTEGMPAFHEYTFNVDEPADTFVDFEGFGKGCIFLNGFNLGRFWEIGPQRRLYVPAPLLKKGENTLLVFETEGKYRDTIALEGEPKLEDEKD